MKVLAFTDTHGSPNDLEILKNKAKQADIIICGGDFTIFENEIEYIMHGIDKLPKKVYLIHGNHEDEGVCQVFSEHFKNIEFIHKKIIELDDAVIIGYGGGGFSLTDNEYEKFMTNTIKKHNFDNKKVIFVYHGPPHGTKVDNLSMGHVGNKSYTKWIKKVQPKFAFCGHLHELFGKKDKIGKTTVVNPGPEGEIFEV